MSVQAPSVRPRERDAILQALGAGVVPRTGLRHVQVGRVREVEALLKDLDRVADGGASIRFVIGEYGSGKTFFLQLMRQVALEKRLVTVQADLTPDRRLHATGGQARSLYAELMRTMASRSKPDGGALASVVERFITSALSEAGARRTTPQAVITERLDALSEMVGGYDFAQVIGAYWRGHDAGDDRLRAAAVRWLRGEFTTRTDARAALGVRTIVDDASVYDHLKLMARFVRLAGFDGLLVCLDELVNLYKLANTRARAANYEQILRIVNDTFGDAEGIGFLLGGTPDFLLDPHRGLYSYEALQSRLAENAFAVNGLVDYSGPVLRLANLAPEDLFVLLQNIRNVHASGDPTRHAVPDEAIHAFIRHCSRTIGEAYFRTPRTSIKSWVSLLAVLEQNPGASWSELLGQVRLEEEGNPDLEPLPAGAEEAGERSAPGDELSSFRI